MTLTDFAALFGTGLTVKYADPTLVTGSDNGADWANAFKTPASLIAAEAAGWCVAVKSCDLATTTTWAAPTTAGTAAQPIVWVAVDGSDNVVDDTNWKGYGHAVGVYVDMTGRVGDQRGINSNAAYRFYYGFHAYKANHALVNLSGVGNVFRYCKTEESVVAGMYNNGVGCVVENCIFDGDVLGINLANAALPCRRCHFNACTVAVSGSYPTFSKCLFTNNTKAATCGSTVINTFLNCAFRGNTTDLDPSSASAILHLINCTIANSITFLDLANTGQCVVLRNLRYYNVTNFAVGVGAGNVTSLDGVSLLTSDPFPNAGSGNYMSDSTIAILRNYMTRINAATYVYEDAGLPQEVVAGAKRRPRIRTHGV